MKQISTNWKLIAFYSLLIILLAVFMPRELDWSPTFSLKESSPYGAEALFLSLDQLFQEEITIAEKPLYNELKDTSFQDASYIIVSTDFYTDSLDLNALYSFVESGNQALIAAESFNREFLDSLGVSLKGYFNDFNGIEDLRSVSTQMRLISADSSYSFKSQWSNAYFSVADSAKSDILTIGWQDTMANFIRVPFGRGYFLLHSFPYALTNYYLINEGTTTYLSAILSHLPVEHQIIWDEYYKPNQQMALQSPLSVLMRYPSFRWIYWISISGLLLFILFFAKRQQRPIPVIEPLKNESLDFAKTLGSLYYNKADHREIFDKKVKVLKEFIARKYNIKDLKFERGYIDTVAKKSGKSHELVSRIFTLIDEYSGMKKLSDAQLKAVVKKINEFYHK